MKGAQVKNLRHWGVKTPKILLILFLKLFFNLTGWKKPGRFE